MKLIEINNKNKNQPTKWVVIFLQQNYNNNKKNKKLWKKNISCKM